MNNSTNKQQNTPVNKAKWAAYQKQYRLDNKAKITATRSQYSLNNKAKIDAYNKRYRLDNKAKMAAYDKQRNLDNKAEITVKRKQYLLDNKNKIAACNKRYRLKNKDKLAIKYKQYHKQRLQVDLLYRIKNNLRGSVCSAFRRIGKNKPARTEQLLGCSWIEAKAYFEQLFKEGMTWENHGEWHIDHIKPVAAFKANELHLMNHINNLQPLWAEENLGYKKVLDNIKWEL